MAYINGKNFLLSAKCDPDSVYPVGSIYLSADATSPAELFGGTWTKITNRVLVGAGGSYSLKATGGSATHTHTLDAGYAKIYVGGMTGSNKLFNYGIGTQTKQNVTAFNADRSMQITNMSTNVYSYNEEAITASALGGNTDSASNMPPYMAVNIWRRTA